MNAWVARDRSGQIVATIPNDPKRQGAVAMELAAWRRRGWTRALEQRAEAPQKRVA